MAVPSGFRPKLSPQQVRDYKRLYEQQPDKFNEETLQALEQHAEFYKLPFAESNESFMGKVGSVMKQYGAGFAEGYTTFGTSKFIDPPKDDAEAIGRNLGHLAGFVGYIPSMPFKALGALKLAQAAKAARGTSVPLRIADAATKLATKQTNAIFGKALGARAEAAGTARNFLQNNVVKDMLSGGFHLGVASAVGSWRFGVDEMLNSFIHGAETGAVFRGIGNLMQTGSDKADKVLRSLSSSLYTGLPATVRGDTTPMQIYEYVLGAYFGYNEMPVHRRMGRKHLAKMMEKKERDPEVIEGWHKIDKPGQDWVKKELTKIYDPALPMTYAIMKNMPGIKFAEANKMAKQYLEEAQTMKGEVEFTKEGEPMRKLTEEELERMDFSSEDGDAQNKPEMISLNAKSFVENSRFGMENHLAGFNKGQKLNVAKDLHTKWLELISKARKDGKNVNPSGEMIEFIRNYKPKDMEDYTPFSPDAEARAFWKKIGFMRLRDEPVAQITMKNGIPRIMELDKDGGSINAAGDRKQLTQENKRFDEVYRKDSGEDLPAYAIIDHFTRTGKDHRWKSYELENYQDYLIESKKEQFKDAGYKNFAARGKDAGEAQYKKEVARLYYHMHSNEYYYYGGRGDAQRMYFARYHPNAPKGTGKVNAEFDNVMRALKKAGVNKADRDVIKRNMKSYVSQNIGGMRRVPLEVPGKRKRDWTELPHGYVKKTLEQMYKRAFISNLIYDLRLNGYQVIKNDKVDFKSPEVSKALMDMKGQGFINNAKSHNKRSQIWFTSGYSADSKAVTMDIEKSRSKQGLETGIKDGRLNIRLIKDLGYNPKEGHKLGADALEYLESSDGAILARADVIDALNRTSGLPTEGGVNKSFIVSPNPQYGALLGKYMMFSPTKKLNDYMEKNNIHMIIPESSAKQWGTRKFGKGLKKIEDLDVDPNYNKATKEGLQIGIEDIKTVMSEKTDRHFIEKQRLPKQMLTNLSAFSFFDKSRAPFTSAKKYHERMQEIIDDMYDTITRNRINGTEEFNQIVESMTESPGSVTPKEIDRVINNLEKVGIRELLSALKAPGNELFANRAYSKIQRVNRDILEMEAAEEGLTRGEVDAAKREMAEFQTVHDRINRVVDDSLAGFLHKFSRDYRMATMRNYIINGITRPEIENSGITRMRPFEVGFLESKAISKLRKDDTIFFLDDGFKDMMVNVSGLGRAKTKERLEDVWNDYQKNPSPEMKEFFRAVLTRVPMDSMSGANVLNFGGFTGVRGYGTLLHGRSMKQLGGADLDGDKAWVFFGGQSESGNGVGFKKSWKDAYDWSRNEFVNKKGYEEDSKNTENPLSEIDKKTGRRPTYRDELTITNQALKDEISTNRISQYSPMTRRRASEAAYGGRRTLGMAVTQTAAVRAAHSTIMAKPNNTLTWFHPTKVNGRWVNLTMEAKALSSDKNMRSFRGVSRAAVGLGSDPMDEAGLRIGKYGENLMEHQGKALFEFKASLPNGKTYLDHAGFLKKYGNPLVGSLEGKGAEFPRVISLMRNINSALYSRNWKEGRRFHMFEIQEKLRNIETLTSGLTDAQRNTLLPKLATDLQNIDWSDGALRRVDIKRLDDIYIEHHNNLKSYDWLRDVLGRDTLAVMRGKYNPDAKPGEKPFKDGIVDFVIKNRLHEEGMREQLNPSHENYIEDIFNNPILKEYTKRSNYIPVEKSDTSGYMAQRKQYLNDIVRRAEDYIINDLSDIASIKRIVKLSEDIPLARIKKLASMTDEIKRRSYVNQKRLRGAESKEVPLDQFRKNFLNKLSEQEATGEKMTSALNQAQVDNLIRADRADLSIPERNLYDAFLLGTLWKGKQFDIKAFIKKHGEPRQQEKKDMLEDWAEHSKKTTLSRAGYNSEAIPDTSVRGMLGEYGMLFKYSTEKVEKKEVEKVEEAFEQIDKPQKMIGPDGKRIEGQVVEIRDQDPKTRRYFNEYAPFVGLYEGKLPKEQAEVALSIQQTLRAYGQPWTAVDLNGFMRTLVNKDANQASFRDWQTLDTWLKETRSGTWYQRMFRPNQAKPELSRWYSFMFPKAISQDMLRNDLKLVDGRNRWKDSSGWVIGDVKVPENTMSTLQRAAASMTEHSTQMYEEVKSQWDNDIRPYYEGLKDGAELWRIAVRKRELGIPDSMIKQEYGKHKGLYNAHSKPYFEAWRKIEKEYDWNTLQDKIYDVSVGKDVVKMTGAEVVSNVNKIITKWNERVHGWMNGQKDYETGDTNFKRKYGKIAEEPFNKGHRKIADDFIKRFNEAILTGKRLELPEGLDGMREIAKSHQISMFRNADIDVQNNMKKFLDIGGTGKIEYDYYWPHIAMDKKTAAKGLKEAIAQMAADPSLSKADKSNELTKAILHYKQATGDFLNNSEIADPYNRVSEALADIARNKKKSSEHIKWLKSPPRVGAQHSRNSHVPGWSVEPEVYTQYMKGVIDNMYKHAAQIKMRDDIYKFQQESFKKHNDPDYTQNWVDFFRLYAQESLGYPSEIPEKVMNNPNMKIKGTPYAWFADNTVKKRVNFIRDKLGIGKIKDKDIPEELRGIDFNSLAKFSNLEAKYQLASLLAHPKSAVANLYGGTVHTLISTGYHNLKNARDIKYLRANVNKEWKSLEDVNDWVYKLGVVEDFLIHEAGLNPKFKGKKWGDFLKDAVGKIKKDPNLADQELKAIAKKHGISDSIFNTAAWFMRRPERTLRRDAFMAHYLQARDNFSGAIRKFDDPTLIELGKKGVKATQFLYSAPFRPAFSRSSAGKVFSRFQLWSWNSVRFRNEVIREANLRGWREGTPEFERYKRMATADLFMTSMAGVFMYSLFESALPAPYNWFQDFADWIYGDEKERDRAFFGAYPTAVAPLQLVTPPSLRILPPVFKGLVTQEWDKLADYYVWTMFPFGRMARDVLGPGSLIENPMRAIEKTTGLPYMQFAKEATKYREEKGKGPKGLLDPALKFGGDEES